MTLDYDTEKVDQTVLALLSLTIHDIDQLGQGRSWKGHDWDVLQRLHEKGLISDPATKAKSVLLSPGGVAEADRLFKEMFAKHTD